jgi:hypothetical protein
VAFSAGIGNGFKFDTRISNRLISMPQILLPFFPEEIRLINSHIGFQRRNGVVYYFNESMPVY